MSDLADITEISQVNKMINSMAAEEKRVLVLFILAAGENKKHYRVIGNWYCSKRVISPLVPCLYVQSSTCIENI